MAAKNPHRSHRLASLLLFPILLVTPARADEAPAGGELNTRLAALETAFERERRKQHVPGAALVVVQDDRVLLAKGFGDRDRERCLPVTPDTLFAIGSCSKAFTAVTVMMSVDDGKLSLADPPRKYLPYFSLQDPEADAKITVADLLCHRSGLDRTDLSWYTGVLRSRDVIRVAGQAKPAAKFGEKFLYQNVMYLAAGEIVARVQDASWSKVVERRIFRPLGMRQANTSVPKMLDAPDHALGYSYSAATKETTRLPMRNLSSVAPAGAINAGASDMARWIRFMLGDGSFEGKRLVSPERFRALTEKQMTIVGDVAYGYGWMLQEWRGHRVVAHGGGIDGFTAEVALMPEKRLGCAILTNLNAAGLGVAGRNLVWRHLVGEGEPEASASAEPAAAGAPEAAVDPAAEAGAYRLAEANVDITVAWKDGKLTIQVPGQPAVALERVAGRRYKAAPPAPDGTFVTFRTAEKDPKQAEMFLEQGGGPRVVLPKLPPKEETAAAPPSISVDALMQKVIEALGGEEALRRHRTLVLKADMVFESQGLTARGRIYSRAPNHSATEVTLYGAGKKIGTIRDYYDGTGAAAETSFGPAAPRSGKGLADARIAADFAPELNWKSLFKSVTITKMEKVGDEEAYVVQKTPEEGNPVTDHISAKTFLPLKRSYQATLPGADIALPVTETFSDYRPVDGVMIAFRRVQTAPSIGDVVLTIREARFNARVPDRAFRPSAAK
jgi:CubicO group peptidase (beta-lactamase class C family)